MNCSHYNTLKAYPESPSPVLRGAVRGGVFNVSALSFRPHRASSAGLGLVEVICSTLIVGIMLVAALETVGAVFRTQRLNADRLTGPNLALELMTEVLSMPYEDPEVDETDIGNSEDEGAASREHFDDVDDYNGWDDQVEDKVGTPRDGFSAWQRQVVVEWVDPLTGAVEAEDTSLKRITVTVTSPPTAANPSGDDTKLSAYRAKDGMLERTQAEITAVTWLGATLQLGAGNASASVGTNVTNHATDAD
jgi:hypothetical protein